MLDRESSPNLSLTQIVERIFRFRQITPIDLVLLNRVVLSGNSLSSQEHDLIRQLQDDLLQGKIWVADESGQL
ncbi:MAG: hypothetical protein J7641_01520 [Cyanobacteria bacterium SID2]|nr:hypothetical protein [Cyanobacteria bacterium SID2]MBP0004387.1 hypothetical protein [Cyanobacteria bacterium SBC]